MCARPSWQKCCCVLRASHQNVSFATCEKMWSCRFAPQAWHFVTFDVMCVHDRREGKIAVPMGKVTKTCLSTL